MKKNMTDKQELLESNSFKGKLLRFFKKYEGYFLGGLILSPLVLYGIGMTLGADSPFALILCLPMFICTVLLFVGIAVNALDNVKEKGYTKGRIVGLVLAFILAGVCVLGFFIFVRNIITSFNPPSIELTHLSAEYDRGSDGGCEYCGYSDSWTLYGVDSNGKEYALSMEEEDWNHLDRIGKQSKEGWSHYCMEFDDDVRIIGHYLPDSSKLVDFEIE